MEDAEPRFVEDRCFGSKLKLPLHLKKNPMYNVFFFLFMFLVKLKSTLKSFTKKKKTGKKPVVVLSIHK